MKDLRLHEIDRDLSDKVWRLLNDNNPMPNYKVMRLTNDGKIFFEASSLISWLTEMEIQSVSDQKQEVYRGLRLLLSHLVTQKMSSV